jgi:hypothetical protein
VLPIPTVLGIKAAPQAPLARVSGRLCMAAARRTPDLARELGRKISEASGESGT